MRVQQKGIKRRVLTKLILIRRRRSPRKDNENATCSKEVFIVNSAKEKLEIVVISDDDDGDNVCSN